MVTKILNYRYIQVIISTFIVLGAVLCIFTPNYYLFKMGSEFAIQIMLGYLVGGFIFLYFQQPKLTFTSFACCAGLCLFLKHSTNTEMKAPIITDSEIVNIAHFNLSSTASDYEETIKSIIESDADLVSIQELTPDWLPVLEAELSEIYPYSSSIVRMDPFGIAVLSKRPMLNLDTFYYENIPNLAGTLTCEKGKKALQFIAAHTTPPLYQKAHTHMQEHLEVIGNYINKIDLPVVTIGDFYAPPWCREIQDLKYAAGLNDSRRTAKLIVSQLFENPVDYILHSNQLTCINFESISNQATEHIGIKGAYQFNSPIEQ